MISVPAGNWNAPARPLSTVAVKATDPFKVSGFGVTTPDKKDSGKLREGPATVDARSVEMFRSSTMDPALGGGGADVVIAPGDSGGPALFFDNGADAIAGVIMGYRRTANVGGPGQNGGQQPQQQQGGFALDGEDQNGPNQQQQQQVPQPTGQDPGVPGTPQQGGVQGGGQGGNQGGGNQGGGKPPNKIGRYLPMGQTT